MRKSALRVLLALALLPTASRISAQEPASLLPGGGDCFACHGAVGFQKELPNGRIISLHIDKDRFKRSVHVQVGCAACHGENPHAKDLKTVANWQSFVYEKAQICQGCHPTEWQEFRGSIHVTSEDPLAPDRCTRCHNPHDANRLPESKQARVAMCGGCHKTEAATYYQSVHGQDLLLGDSHVAACTDCHGKHNVYGVSSRTYRLTPARIADACSKCHGKVGPQQVAGWYSHRPRTEVQSSIYSIVRGFYWIIIPFTLLSMAFHNALAHRRVLRRRAEERE